MGDSRQHYNNDGMDPDWKPKDTTQTKLTLAIKAIEDAPHSISCPVIAEHYTSQYGINTYKQRDKPAADYLCNCWKAEILEKLK